MKETEEPQGFRGIQSALFSIGFVLILFGVIQTVGFTKVENLFGFGIGILILTAIFMPSFRWSSSYAGWRHFSGCRGVTELANKHEEDFVGYEN